MSKFKPGDILLDTTDLEIFQIRGIDKDTLAYIVTVEEYFYSALYVHTNCILATRLALELYGKV